MLCKAVAVDAPRQSDDALAQPTRARLFALLGELRRPAPTIELAERLGLHPNGVRAHLERLQDAGLVRRERERLCAWPAARQLGDQPGGAARRPFPRLCRAGPLAGAVARRRPHQVFAKSRPPDGRSAASFRPAMLRPRASSQLHDALTSLGFQPEREPVVGDRLTYRLRNCPYRERSGSVRRWSARCTEASLAACST